MGGKGVAVKRLVGQAGGYKALLGFADHRRRAAGVGFKGGQLGIVAQRLLLDIALRTLPLAVGSGEHRRVGRGGQSGQQFLQRAFVVQTVAAAGAEIQMDGAGAGGVGQAVQYAFNRRQTGAGGQQQQRRVALFVQGKRTQGAAQANNRPAFQAA